MSLVKAIKKNKKIVKIAAATLITGATLTFIFIQKGEKKSVLEIDVDPTDVFDIENVADAKVD